MAITVNRKPLTFWEKLYLPAIVGGLQVTLKHAYNTLFKGKVVTMEYPEQKWTLPADYRGAPYLVKDQDGNTKCVSCQLCEFVCPPKAIRITPPGNSGLQADRTNAEKMPAEFESTELRKEVVVPAGGEAPLIIRTLDAGEYKFFDDFQPDAPPALLIAK